MSTRSTPQLQYLTFMQDFTIFKAILIFAMNLRQMQGE